MSLELLYYLISAAFGAGGAFFLLKQARKDVNGLGRKVNNEVDRSARRHQNLSLALMLVAPESKKAEIAELLREQPGGNQ